MKLLLSVLAVLGILLFSPSMQTYAKKTSDPSLLNSSKDEIYKKNIIGYWTVGETPYGITAFLEGGVYKAWAWESPKREKLLFTMIGKWWIENGRLYNTLSEMTPQQGSIEGVVIDEIVAISEKEMTLIDKQGQRYTKIRVSP